MRGAAGINNVQYDGAYDYGIYTGIAIGLGGAGKAGLAIKSKIAKAKKWRSNSKTSRKTRAKKIKQAGTYRGPAVDVIWVFLSGMGVDAWVKLYLLKMGDEGGGGCP